MPRDTYRNGDAVTLTATGCDGCSPAAVNGTLCHEAGCPERWRDYPSACNCCGFDFYRTERDTTFCLDCQAAPEGGTE